MPIKSQDLIKSKNCLNTIRLMAAMQVMFLHMYSYLSQPWYSPVLKTITRYFPGVPIFFMLSGFLIWNSIENSPNYFIYLKKRFLRIYPELWGSVIVEIICIAVFSTQAVPLLGLLIFALGQSTIFQTWVPSFVNYFGCGNPNGALWTIPVMLSFYVIAWWLHKLLHNRKSWIWIALLFLSLVLSWPILHTHGYIPELLQYRLYFSLIPNFWLFMIGMYMAEHIEALLPKLKKYWFVFLILAHVLKRLSIQIQIGDYDCIYSVLIFCTWVGFAYRFPQLNVKTDVSYGLYIYHMIVVNVMLSLFDHTEAWLFPAAVAISFLLAWLSTRLSRTIMHRLRRK